MEGCLFQNRTHVTLRKDGVVLDLVPLPIKVNNLIFGRTWIDSPGDMVITNMTTGEKIVLYFQPCGWFGCGEADSFSIVLQVWKVADVPQNDKFKYTHFAHKINSLDTALMNLLASDSPLCSDRYALGLGDLSKAGAEKSRLEEKQRAEKRSRDTKGHHFTPRLFDLSGEVTPTPWGDLEVYKYNGKYSEHRAVAVDSSEGTDEKMVNL